MPQPNKPRRGSMQIWPRKRFRKTVARIRSWVKESKVMPLGFVGYKAGMTTLMAEDSRPKSMTKGQMIALPATIIECPPLTVCGIVFYKNTKTLTTIWNQKLAKELSKTIPLPKGKATENQAVEKKFPADFDDLRLLVHTNPKQTGIGAKKPKILELALGGKKEEKLAYAKENLGKELKVNDIFEKGMMVDTHGISKGKGFQGTVKRFGVPIRQHKAEKTKRGIGNLGSWTPKRVQFTVAQPGKMGYHLRTDYNKQILQIGHDPQQIIPTGGLIKYGLVKNPYLLLHGSVAGSRKRALLLTPAMRPNKYSKEGLDIVEIRK